MKDIMVVRTRQVSTQKDRCARQGFEILIDESHIPLTWTDWEIPWLLCPGCGRRCRHLYFPELVCRTCLRLDYTCRHVARSVPALHKLKQFSSPRSRQGGTTCSGPRASWGWK